MSWRYSILAYTLTRLRPQGTNYWEGAAPVRIEVFDEFVCFAKYLNFSRAAAELHMTQSALSKHVAALETELGYPLVERHGGVAGLTPMGSRFLESAQKIDALYRSEMAALRRASREAAPVRLLWFDGNDELEGFLHTVDVPFRHLVQTGDESYLSGLVAGKVDVLATYDISQTSLADDARNAGISVFPISSMPGALLVMGSHPLASHAHLRRSDLRGSKVLIPGRGVYDHWSRCLVHLLGEDLELQPCLVPVDENLSNLKYLDFGDAVFCMSRPFIESIARRRPNVRMFAELDGTPLDIPRAILYKPNNPNPNVELLISRAQSWFAGRTDA